METKLEHLLTNSHKAQMISYMRSHPADFNEAFRLAVSDKQPYSWRAAWVLWGCMDKNDKRIRKHLKQIIGSIPAKKDNQQRELLMILLRMELNDNYAGKVFDLCSKIWGSVGKNPSLRYNAFKLMIHISKKHSDLSKEIHSFAGPRYTNMLSASVKRSISKLVKESGS